MKFIQPDAEILEQQIPPFIDNQQVFMNLYLKAMYEHIERCGRVCYKSEDKLGEKDPKIFVDRMVNSGHLSVLEHGTVYLYYKWNPYSHEDDIFISKYKENPYSKCLLVRADDDVWENGSIHDIMNGESHGEGEYVITTNYRVIIENGWEDDLKYLCCPTKYHALRATVCFTTDIGVSREANRHRKNSISEESTRYCNYSKEKFGGGINYAIPSDTTMEEIQEALSKLTLSTLGDDIDTGITAGVVTNGWTAIHWWLWGLKCCEVSYLKQIELGRIPQQARRSLPLNTKTTLIHTAFDSDWQHFWDLRLRGTTGAPHPDMKQLMEIAYNKYLKRYE